MDKKYKGLLLNITKNGDWWEFIHFILEGYAEQALKTKKALSRVKEAKKKLKSFLYNKDNLGIARSNIASVIDHVFHYPLTYPKDMASKINLHWQTCSRYLQNMAEAGFLKVNKAGKYKQYRNVKSLNALSDKDE